MSPKTRRRISANFVVEEFDCHDGQKVPTTALPALERWAVLWGEPLRLAFGPVTVTSGFRDALYNASIGGAKASFHVYNGVSSRGRPDRFVDGVAADVHCKRGDVVQWAAWASRHRARVASLRASGHGGIGVYVRSGFVHLDTGPLRDWRG